MICRIVKHSFEKELEAKYPMLEIRLDTMVGTQIERLEDFIKNCTVPIIATCRYQDAKVALHKMHANLKQDDVDNRIVNLMGTAIYAGTMFVDLEHDMPGHLAFQLIKMARKNKVKVIRSYHGDQTPSIDALVGIHDELVSMGADIVKIAVKGTCEQDRMTVKQLYRRIAHPERLIAFCTGKKQQSSRYTSVKMGAPWIYACAEREKGNELGVPTFEQCEKHIYKKQLTHIVNELYAYSSKSIIQREVIMAALCDKPSIINMIGFMSNDISDAIEAAKQLGARVVAMDSENTKPHRIQIIVHPDVKRKPISEFHCGESGFVTRMMMAIIPVINNGSHCMFYGTGTLTKRNFWNDAQILAQFGVSVKSWNHEEEQPGRLTLPFSVTGRLKAGINIELKNVESSQILSGLTIAEMLMNKKTTITAYNVESLPYLDMTVRLLSQNHRIYLERMSGTDGNTTLSKAIRLEINSLRTSLNAPKDMWPVDSGADWSGMLNFILLTMCCCKTDINVLTDSYPFNHPDLKFLEQYPWFHIKQGPEGMHVRQMPCIAFDFDIADCPDSAMAISLFALLCNGKSHITGVNRLVNKESNRLEAIIRTILQLGGKCKLKYPNTLEIEGMSYEARLLTGKMLHGGEFKSFNDHRIVMMLKCASMFTDRAIIIDSTKPVLKSYPSFINDFDKIRM